MLRATLRRSKKMKEVFTIYDNKAEIYQEPLMMTDIHEFEENLKMSLKDVKEDVNLSEFEVFYLGKYDETTGKYEQKEMPKHLYNCSKFYNELRDTRTESSQKEKEK
jgi:hypothetical protein